MFATKRIILSLALLTFCTAGLFAFDDKVPLDQLPKAVTEAVKTRFPDAQLVSASKSTAAGKTKFEVTIKEGKMSCDVTLTEAGIITGLEKEIAFEALPKVVADAVKAKHASAPIKRTEAVISVTDGKENLDYYEVIVTVDGKDIELEILPDGKLK